jgi:hypothetical protein
LDEPFASKVKILGGPSMVGLHAYGSDTKREPKTNKNEGSTHYLGEGLLSR